jgi:hypothetical protein
VGVKIVVHPRFTSTLNTQAPLWLGLTAPPADISPMAGMSPLTKTGNVPIGRQQKAMQTKPCVVCAGLPDISQMFLSTPHPRMQLYLEMKAL